MRRVSLLLATVVGVLAATHARGESVGPSFSCINPPPKEALEVLTCSSATLSRAEISFVETYYVLRQKVGQAGWPALKGDFLAFMAYIRQTCRVPVTEQAFSLPANAAKCLEDGYNWQRSQWGATLTGVEAEEAGLAPEQFIALQQRLIDLGFLAPSAPIDGIYGVATRDAIIAWQRVSQRPETGFLSIVDARALLSPTVRAPTASISPSVEKMPKPAIAETMPPAQPVEPKGSRNQTPSAIENDCASGQNVAEAWYQTTKDTKACLVADTLESLRHLGFSAMYRQPRCSDIEAKTIVHFDRGGGCQSVIHTPDVLDPDGSNRMVEWVIDSAAVDWSHPQPCEEHMVGGQHTLHCLAEWPPQRYPAGDIAPSGTGDNR